LTVPLIHRATLVTSLARFLSYPVYNDECSPTVKVVSSYLWNASSHAQGGVLPSYMPKRHVIPKLDTISTLTSTPPGYARLKCFGSSFVI
jgi:hypothetical protein